MQGRLHWIDVMKGLLIYIVIIHHIPSKSYFALGIEDTVIKGLLDWRFLYLSFFMPAFFVATGYCWKDYYTLKKIIISGLKTLILPSVLLGLIWDKLHLIVIHSTDIHQWLSLSIKGHLLNGGSHWFLASMFLCRIWMWIICKLPNNYVQWSTAVLLSVIGVILSNMFPSLYNFWSFEQSFIFLPFIYLGYILGGAEEKSRMSIGWVSVCVFICGTIGYYAFTHTMPTVSAIIDVNLIQYPLYVLLASSGTITLIKLSQIINNNLVLEYYGRNSLIIYCMHFVCLEFYFYFTKQWFNVSLAMSVLLTIGSFVFVLIVMPLFIRIFTNSRMKWLIGKF